MNRRTKLYIQQEEWMTGLLGYSLPEDTATALCNILQTIVHYLHQLHLRRVLTRTNANTTRDMTQFAGRHVRLCCTAATKQTSAVPNLYVVQYIQEIGWESLKNSHFQFTTLTKNLRFHYADLLTYSNYSMQSESGRHVSRINPGY